MRILELDLGFEQHNELNPLLWQDEELRPEVKMALLKIAKDFVEYVEVPFEVFQCTVLLSLGSTVHCRLPENLDTLADDLLTFKNLTNLTPAFQQSVIDT